MSVSILILTKNEEKNIPGLFDSLEGFDDIVLFDSLSEDRTVELARERGARIVEREFTNWAAHQNWAMENIDFKYPWVLYLDADERMRPELKAEIERIASDPDEKRVAFYCGRRNYFMDRWLKHSMPPGHIMRFFKPKHIRFERVVNPVPVMDGPHGYLKETFDHYLFSNGLTHWFARHNWYSDGEAEETMKSLRGGDFKVSKLFSSDALERRIALKELSYRMPGRPFLKFAYMYVLKLGFLDGRPGLTYCTMQAVYEYMISLKVRELKRAERGLTPS